MSPQEVKTSATLVVNETKSLFDQNVLTYGNGNPDDGLKQLQLKMCHLILSYLLKINGVLLMKLLHRVWTDTDRNSTIWW